MKIFKVAYRPDFSYPVGDRIYDLAENISMVSPNGDTIQVVFDEDIEKIVEKYGDENDKKILEELKKEQVDYIEL